MAGCLSGGDMFSTAFSNSQCQTRRDIHCWPYWQYSLWNTNGILTESGGLWHPLKGWGIFPLVSDVVGVEWIVTSIKGYFTLDR